MNRLTELMELMGFLRSRVRSCFWPLLQAPGNPERTINSINSVNLFFGIENRLLDLVDTFNANGAHTKAASSPLFVLWKHVFGPQ